MSFKIAIESAICPISGPRGETALIGTVFELFDDSLDLAGFCHTSNDPKSRPNLIRVIWYRDLIKNRFDQSMDHFSLYKILFRVIAPYMRYVANFT